MIRCCFALDGRTLEGTQYVSVYRKCDMLVIEFINNLIVPLQMVDAGGVIDFYILGTRVFSMRAEFSTIALTIKHFHVVGGAEFVIQPGGQDGILCNAISGLNLEVGSFRFLQTQVHQWACSHGVSAPLGCIMTVKGDSVESGCSIINRGSHFLVRLPNSLYFPIYRTQCGVRVVNTDIVCSKFMLFVRVHEVTDNYVRFRVAVYWKRNLRVLDDIMYMSDGVHYDGSLLSGGTIAKLLVLGG